MLPYVLRHFFQQQQTEKGLLAGIVSLKDRFSAVDFSWDTVRLANSVDYHLHMRALDGEAMRGAREPRADENHRGIGLYPITVIAVVLSQHQE